jgi:hypothetical protein
LQQKLQAAKAQIPKLQNEVYETRQRPDRYRGAK